jgi:hypothetical protein
MVRAAAVEVSHSTLACCGLMVEGLAVDDLAAEDLAAEDLAAGSVSMYADFLP